MSKITIELPDTSLVCGGIRDSLILAERFDPKMMVRFQTMKSGYPQIPLQWTVGLPDRTFPETDICITYSDNPYAEQLKSLQSVKKLYCLMLSWGMNLKNERRNVHIKGINVLCSSKKIEKAILAEGVNVKRIGIGLDMSKFYNTKSVRKNYIAILYHSMPSKRYAEAVQIADNLYGKGLIEGVITFGQKDNYSLAKKPKGLVRHYENATSEQIREIFNICRCYLMPSSTEGINLTPIESTLCGCPAVISDGAINEVYFNGENCFVGSLEQNCVEILKGDYSERFENHMRETIKDMTWENVINNLKTVL
ncbi:MAG: glycosyltransferase [Sediminibacterium sp.]